MQYSVQVRTILVIQNAKSTRETACNEQNWVTTNNSHLALNKVASPGFLENGNETFYSQCGAPDTGTKLQPALRKNKAMAAQNNSYQTHTKR